MSSLADGVVIPRPTLPPTSTKDASSVRVQGAEYRATWLAKAVPSVEGAQVTRGPPVPAPRLRFWAGEVVELGTALAPATPAATTLDEPPAAPGPASR